MKPILFSTEMVRAILDGRKTMTRRVVKPQHYRKPRYQTGDILWVRETWSVQEDLPYDNYVYRSDYGTTEHDSFPPSMFKWRPSIHMPKEAARIFLCVTDVRVERVQDILCGDMKREGCIPETVTGGQYQQWHRDYWIPLWDSINDKRGYPWSSNPWVWVYSFKRCDKPETLEAVQ